MGRSGSDLLGPRVTRLTGLVLAGGRSRRMGVDKAQLSLAGVPLIERVVAALREISEEVLVASGDGERLPGEWRQIPDALPDAGPVGGVLAGLAVARTPLLAVLAVDLPNPDPALLRWLARQHAGEPAVVPHADGRLQPLHAVYDVSAREALVQAVSAGQRSLTRILPALGARVVTQEEWSHLSQGAFAINLNTPDQARAAGVEPGGG